MNKKNFLFLLFLYIFCLFFYLKDIETLLNKENILTSFDGYYFANLAKKLINDTYTSIDYLCNVPDFCISLNPPPMHSYIAYLLNKIFNLDLKYSILFFSPILSGLFIFTMYFYVRKFLPVYAFISAAILGALNPIYFSRNLPGRFDTDSLILFFVFLILFIILKLIENLRDIHKTIVFTVLIILSSYIFMWWYFKPLFISVFLLSLFFGFFAFYYKNMRDNKVIKNFSIAVFIYIAALFEFIKMGFLEIIWKFIYYFLKEPSDFLPESIRKFIAELHPANLKILLYNTTDNVLLFILCSLGFLVLMYKHFKYVALAVPVILIGVLSFKSGIRFLIYLIPFWGLGLGYIFYIFYSYLSKKFIFLKSNTYKFLLVLIIFAASIPTSLAMIKNKPVITDKFYESLKNAKYIFSENSFIWSTWSHGNIYEFLLEKGCYTDNHNHILVKNYAIANSLYTSSYERSYKLISFVTNNFSHQYNKLKFEEFNKSVNSYNKKPKNDVYIIFNRKVPFEISTTRLGVYGTNIKHFEIPMLKNITQCEQLNEELFDCNDFIFNVKDKFILWNIIGGKASILDIYFIERDSNKIEKIKQTFILPSDKKLILELNYLKKENKLYYSYLIEPFFKTVLNRLYLLKENNIYFQPVYDDFPYLVVYKVVR